MISPKKPKDRTVALERRISALETQLLQLKKHVYRLEAIQKLADAGRQPVYPVEFRSQYGEDAMIWELLEGQMDGFFIEAGAFDGYNFSVTYALECLGWRGLLVEPIPERAEQCRARRGNSRVVHAALGAGHGGTTSFTITQDRHGGMLSCLDPESALPPGVATAGRRTVAVPLTTLNELLKDCRDEIDLAVIDVEGSELAVLAGFDLRKHKPKVMLIEDNARGADPSLANYMAAMPYKQIAWVKVNRVYLRADLAIEWEQRLRP